MAVPGCCVASAVLMLAVLLSPAQANAQLIKTSENSPKVRVVPLSGALRVGRLVSLSTDDVTMERDGVQIAIPLSGVLRVERVTHHAPALTITGFAGGYLYGTILAGLADDLSREAGLLCGALFAGVGAMIGLIWDQHPPLLYAAPSQRPRVDFHPIFKPDGAGVAVAFGW